MGSDATHILMLHRVLDDAPAAFGLPGCYRLRGTALTMDELVRVLDRSGPILPLDVVERALACGEAPPSGSVLTFDDGYREHLDCVVPLLEERGITATFYIATGLHGAGRAVAAVDAWYWLLDHANGRVAQVPLPDGGIFRGAVDTLEGKLVWVGGLPKAALLEATPDQQAAMIAALAAAVGTPLPEDLAAGLYLTPAELRTLVSHGMRVGAHSMNHPRLPQTDDATLRVEVGASIAQIAALDAPVTFAYPDGAHDDRVVAEVRRAGVASAVTCEAGGVTPRSDPLRLPRCFVSPVLVATAAAPDWTCPADTSVESPAPGAPLSPGPLPTAPARLPPDTA